MLHCQGVGHKSAVCPSVQSVNLHQPRRRRRRGRGRGRGGRGRGGAGGSRQINELDESEVEDYTSEFSSLSLAALRISSLDGKSKKRFVKFRFHDPALRKSFKSDLKIDSGAEANVMTLSKYKELFPARIGEDGLPFPTFVRKSNRRLEAYGGVEVPHLGTVNLPCEYGGKKFMCKFFLCDIEGSMLLGLPTCEKLGIVKITVIDEVSKVEEVEKSSGEESEGNPSVRGNGYINSNVPIEDRPLVRNKEDLRRMYPECFETEGKGFQDYEYEIKLDPSISPKVHPLEECLSN